MARKEVYTTGELAAVMRVASRTVAKWIDSGALQGYRLVGSQDRRVTREHLIRFLRENRMPIPGGIEWAAVVAGVVSPEIVRHLRLLDGSEFQVFEASTVLETGIAVGTQNPDCLIVDVATFGVIESCVIAQDLRWSPVRMIALSDDPEERIVSAYHATYPKTIDPAILAANVWRVLVKPPNGVPPRRRIAREAMLEGQS